MEINGTGNNIGKIFYISDWHVAPGYYSYDKHRFPQAYIELVPWYIVNWKDIDKEITGVGNTIMLNSPVHDELSKLKIAEKLISKNDVYIIQEGSIWDWFDWPAPEQELYIKLLSKSKAFLCSNDFEKQMMKIFVNKTIKATPCTNYFIEEARQKLGDYIFIVNPCKRYQRGMISHKLVYESVDKNFPVYTMVYNRPNNFSELLSFPDSYTMPGFKQLNYMKYEDFINTTYNSRFGVDIHRDFSAGQTAVDFGALGVPLVGNIQLDSQREIFPDISFEWNDYDNIKKCIKLLSIDDDFCLEVGKKALENAKLKYNSQTAVSNFINEFNQTLNI